MIQLVEEIRSDGHVLAYVVRAEARPEVTSFLTPVELTQQLGFVVYPAGGVIRPHVHLPLERPIVGTTEVLLVRAGRCEIDLYDDERKPVATCELGQGDVILIARGGHGLRMLEDTVLFEVKQGPYLGIEEKEYF